MCNVPAPLRRRHDGGTGTPPFSRLRCSAARERVVPSSSPAGVVELRQILVVGVTYSVFFVTSLAGRERPTNVLLSPMTIKTRTSEASGIASLHKF